MLEKGSHMIVQAVTDLVQETLRDMACELYDVVYEQVDGEWYLRIFADKIDGDLDLDTCVALSEAISALLDEADLISHEYYLEVSSPGAERPLKSLAAVKAAVGEYIYMTFAKPQNGLTDLYGTLRDVHDDILEVDYLVKNIQKHMAVAYADIAFIRLAVRF